MIHLDTKLQPSREQVGLGVFATARIPRGTLVYVKDLLDLEISPIQYSRLDEKARAEVDKFSYVAASGVRVLSWDIAKYVNHSCRPNSMLTGWGFVMAVEDIEAGEEITDEYGLLNMAQPMRCACGSSLCRGRVATSDFDALFVFWDELIQAALCFADVVEQPLWSLMDPETEADLKSYLQGAAPYRSVRRLAPPRYEICG